MKLVLHLEGRMKMMVASMVYSKKVTGVGKIWLMMAALNVYLSVETDSLPRQNMTEVIVI